MTLRLRMSFASAVVAVLGSGALAQQTPEPSTRLGDAIEAFQIEVVAHLTKPRGSELCNGLLDLFRSDGEWSVAPTVETETIDSDSLSPYKAFCPSLQLTEWYAPPGLRYTATRGFRVYDAPAGTRVLTAGRHFLFYGESYFSSFVKEQFRDRPDIYPWAGYASAGDRGVYSLVDTTSCERTIELPVHGGYDHRAQQKTGHHSSPFLYGGEFYVYDFQHLADQDKDYAGVTVWHLVDPRTVEQVCVLDSADSRQLRDAALEGAVPAP